MDNIFIVLSIVAGVVVFKMLDVVVNKLFKNLGQEVVTYKDLVEITNGIRCGTEEKLERLEEKISFQLNQIRKMILLIVLKKDGTEIKIEEVQKIFNEKP